MQNALSVLTNCPVKQNKKLLLFDLSIRGHHPSYIKNLLEYWYAQNSLESLEILVSPDFIEEHYDVVDLALKHKDNQNIKFTAITPEEQVALSSRKSSFHRNYRNFREWQMLCKYAALLKASHCLIMYFDTYQLPLMLGVKPPCPFSGIYFRPTFHYGDFNNYRPSWKDRMQQLREKVILSRILQNPQLQTLFCLDPFALKHIHKFHTHVKAVHLPDPVQIPNNFDLQSHPNKQALGIDPNRQVFLLFGALTERKGIYQLLDAILTLPSELCQKLCLLIVGESSIKDSLETKISQVCQAKPVQVIRRYEFIPDRDMQGYFQLADVVLAPYQRHVGMSGILLLAAAAQKPVLSSDYGLMGEIVQQQALGLTVDSTQPDEIAKGLTQFLLQPVAELGDRTRMKQFAEQNSAEEFARVIFNNISI